MDAEKKRLKTLLDGLYERFDIAFLSTDPLEFVHRYDNDADREVAGLITSSLAYGRVDGIKRSVGRVLSVMGKSPARFAASFDPERDAGLFSGFIHRFNDGRDVACLIYYAGQMIRDSGSIGAFFMRGYDAKEKNVKGALVRFVDGVFSLDSSAIYGRTKLPPKAGVRFFFPSPSDGSPCKRLNLYLRWMVRRGDKLDFGIWKGVDTGKLVMPLDTHVARISRNIGLTKRANADWRMAEEVTDALKELDPRDPVKYDFAICRLGIIDECPRRADGEKCRRCAIKNICIL